MDRQLCWIKQPLVLSSFHNIPYYWIILRSNNLLFNRKANSNNHQIKRFVRSILYSQYYTFYCIGGFLLVELVLSFKRINNNRILIKYWKWSLQTKQYYYCLRHKKYFQNIITNSSENTKWFIMILNAIKNNKYFKYKFIFIYNYKFLMNNIWYFIFFTYSYITY